MIAPEFRLATMGIYYNIIIYFILYYIILYIIFYYIIILYYNLKYTMLPPWYGIILNKYIDCV